MNIWKTIYLNCGERYEDMIYQRSYTHNLSSSEKKNSAWTGFKPMTSAILVQWTELSSHLGAGHIVSSKYSTQRGWRIYLNCGKSKIFLSSSNIWPFKHSFAFFTFGFISKSQCDRLSDGSIAQLVEYCTGIAEVMGLNSVQAWIFRT